MRDDLLHYYERELSYLRHMGKEFADKYPKVASRLQLEPHKCEDPHVERLLEGFAFLAARVHLKIEDDFPEITEALLNIVYPHYIRPIPAMSLVEFRLDPEQGKLTTGFPVPRESLLYYKPPVGRSASEDVPPCKFRTCYDTTLWPITITAAEWRTPDQLTPPIKTTDAVAALRVGVQCLPDVAFNALELSTLRFHLNGESNLVATLYELLCNNCTQIMIRDRTPASKRQPVVLPASALRPVGFAEHEGVLPQPRRSFLAYRLLREYFTFPAKFFFLDVSGFDRVAAAGFESEIELVFLIAPFERADRRQMLEAGVTRDTLRLGCTPVVNLFPQTTEPVSLTQRVHEHMVVPDARRRETTGIFSIDEVKGMIAGSPEPVRFEPLYAYRHGVNGGGPRLFWLARRRPVGWRADGSSEVYLSFVDLSGRTVQPSTDTVTAHTTCYNLDLPSRLPFGKAEGDFVLAEGGPIKAITALINPTKVLHPPLGKPQLWRLISQLSLNYVSLVEGGVEALQELLRLYNVETADEWTAREKEIQGITTLRSSPCYSRITSEHGLTFARGHRVEIEFDEEQFAGGSVYLFASMIERVLGLCASLNSFSILAVRTQQRKEILREWMPRAGAKALL
ncbi:MAG: type VI secretion system baseplate subunit TssF [Acidobacteriota bacterium]|nr:type VI secretion system baseplate subunit TssF [Acidobacteriota bacterium]